MEFNEELFYPNMISDEDKKAIKNSGMFPAIQFLNHAFDVYVGKYYHADTATTTYCELFTKRGTRIFDVRIWKDVVSVGVATYIHSKNTETIAESKDNRYLLRRLEKIIGLPTAEKNSLGHLRTLLNRELEMVFENLYEYRLAMLCGNVNVITTQGEPNDLLFYRFRYNLHSIQQEYLAKYFLSDGMPTSMQNDIRSHLYAIRSTIEERRAKEFEHKDKQKELLKMWKEDFDKPKWLIGWHSVDERLVFGCVNPRSLCSELEHQFTWYDKCRVSPLMTNFESEDYPIRLYKSINDIPSEVKESVLATLTFNKVAYADSAPRNIQPFGEEGLILNHAWNNQIPSWKGTLACSNLPDVNANMWSCEDHATRSMDVRTNWYMFDRKDIA